MKFMPRKRVAADLPTQVLLAQGPPMMGV